MIRYDLIFHRGNLSRTARKYSQEVQPGSTARKYSQEELKTERKKNWQNKAEMTECMND